MEKTNDLKEKLDDYLASLEMGESKHLLVEGATDIKIFKVLLDHLTNFDHDIEIRSAEDIDVRGYGQIGNRNIVKFICKVVFEDDRLKSQGVSFAGFVDREFDYFDLDKLRDLLEEHYKEGYLVYSRGHSIENYLFDISLFNEVLFPIFKEEIARRKLQQPEASQFLREVQTIFYEVINSACAIGLAAKELEILDKVKNITLHKNIDVEILRVENNHVFIDFEKWKLKLEEGQETFGLEDLISKYNFYLNKIIDANLNTVKYLCHGHLGLNLILFACCCCLKKITTLEQKTLEHLVGRFRGLSSEGGKLFETCALEWSRQVKQKNYEYPRELFLLLGVSSETRR